VRVLVKEVINAKAILDELSPDLSLVGLGPPIHHGLKHTPKRLHMVIKFMSIRAPGVSRNDMGKPSHSSPPGTRDMCEHSEHNTSGIVLSESTIRGTHPKH
jgi:hypothetical protein